MYAIRSYYAYNTSNPSCIGNNDGYVEIMVVGGTEPYLFGWDEYFIDIPLISGLRQGTYNITVTDFNNCPFVFSPIILTDEDVDCIRIPNARITSYNVCYTKLLRCSTIAVRLRIIRSSSMTRIFALIGITVPK